MKSFKTRALILFFSLTLLTAASFLTDSSAAHRQNQPTNATTEEAYRANNIGVALLEQFKYKEAADTFRRALQLEPKLSLARINLGIALFNIPDLPAAQRELQNAIALAPGAPQPHYILGLAAKTQNRPEEAIAHFQQVIRIDPNDVGSNVNLGQLFAQQRKYPEAIAVLRLALAAEPYNATALYNLGTSLLRSGQREEGQRVINQFQELRQRGSGSTLGTNYLEQGRYAEAIVSTGAEPELVDRAIPSVTFTDATAAFLPINLRAGEWANTPSPLGRKFKSADSNDVARIELAMALGGNITLFDSDLDGDLDLFWVSPIEQR